MCKSKTEVGGPYRCPSDARVALESSALTVQIHKREISQLERELDRPPVDDIATLIAAHPDREEMIRDMDRAGVRMHLSDEFVDSDGTPTLVIGERKPSVPPEPEAVSFADIKGAERVAAMRAEVDAAMERLDTAQDWARFAEHAAQFHNYSMRNRMLIRAQNPDASNVASFNTWKSMGRSVTKGEKAIWITAPMTRKVIDKNVATGAESEKGKIIGFKAVPVYDISQTNGDPLPEPPRRSKLLSGQAPPGMASALTADIESKGFEVSYKPMGADTGSMGGYTDFTNKQVVINSDRSDAGQSSTLAHELAHIECGHDARVNAYHNAPGGERPDMEVEAETVAYIVSKSYGLDTSDKSFGYIDGWAKGNKDRVKATAAAVDKAALGILKRLKLPAATT